MSSPSVVKPTVGRMVHYVHNGTVEAPSVAYGEKLAAIVTHVWSDYCVNLTVFDSRGLPFNVTSVDVVQDGDSTAGRTRWCEWPARVTAGVP